MHSPARRRPPAPASAPKEPSRTLMDIMSGYNGRAVRSASIMQRLYNEQRKRQSPSKFY